MSTPRSQSGGPHLDRFAAWWRRHDGAVYTAFCLVCTIFVATRFYGYMLVQTKGQWSAPLDDVFIHFDYARSFARGFPFQWSEGNGYSSGNTSLTYPIVLAFGYWVGFRGLNLVLWSAIVAVVSVAGFLVAAGKLVAPEEDPPEGGMRWVRFLFPPAVLSMGALDWSLFSGMENAFHLGVWGLMLWASLRQHRSTERRPALRRAWLAGAIGALLVATRPESAVCIACFGFFAVVVGWRNGTTRRVGDVIRLLLAYGSPGVAMLLLHGVANHLFTGEWSANGAIAKLFVNNPFLTRGEMWDRYVSLLVFIIPRLFNHHFAELDPIGWLVPALALLPLAARRTRPLAILLWSQAVLWLLLVALNNQLRWHNARYAMPTVSWLLLLAALGIGVIVIRRPNLRRERVARWMERAFPARAFLAANLLGLYWYGQEPRMRDQIWFFGRAARNILDQHVTAGRLLDRMKVRRVLVGDAGALTYASDRPGLDLIGLGGYHAYPFARSTVHGLGASIELIERLPVTERPDVMAIYPSWWGDLPTLFGHYITAVPVRGNVICGGAEKVIYRADWDPLDRRGYPRTARADERVVDELDVADLVSEKSHSYAFPRPGKGFVRYRVLGDPSDPTADLFDAGRIIPGGHQETAQVTLPSPGHAGRLVLRLAPDRTMATEITLDGQVLGTVRGEPAAGSWQEVSLDLPSSLATGKRVNLTLKAVEGESVHYHLWILER